ncbi:MAG: M16 family metallopeptidase [Gammaproteobacteria bacterium]
MASISKLKQLVVYWLEPYRRWILPAAAMLLVAVAVVAVILANMRPSAARQQLDQSAELSLPDLQFDQYQLDNGLTVILHQDNSRPLVAVGVWYGAGSSREWRFRTGLAHVVEHLMFNGSAGYEQDYFVALEEAGVTDINGTTNQDYANYFQTIPSGALKRTLWLEADRMGWMLVDPVRLEQQMGVVQNEKRQREGTPYGTVWSRVYTGIFGKDHPYSWPVIGFNQDLARIDTADVQKFRSAWYRPDNAVLVLAGKFDTPEARTWIEEFFGSVPAATSDLPTLDHTTLPIPENRRTEFQDKVPHARIYRSWQAPTASQPELTAPLYLACQLLGGNKRSILHQRLVLEERLANFAVCYSDFKKLAGHISLIIEAKEEAMLEQIETILHEEINRFIDQLPDQGELELQIQSDIGGTLRQTDKLGGFGGRMSLLATGAILANDPDLWKQEFIALDTQTPRSVRQVAREWLSRPWFQLTVRPGSDIALPIEPFTSKGHPAEPAAQPLPTPRSDTSPLPDLDTLDLPELPQPQKWLLKRTCNSETAKCVPADIPLYLVHRANTPLISMDLQFPCVRRQTEPAGIANFATHMMTQATKNYNIIELEQLSDALAGAFSPYANSDFCGVQATLPTANTQKGLELLQEIAFAPAFEPSDVERERLRWLSAIDREYANARTLAFRALPPFLYGPEHPYGVPATRTGYKSLIKQLSAEDIREWHTNTYRWDRASLIVAGDFNGTNLQGFLDLLRQLQGFEPTPVRPAKRNFASGGCAGDYRSLLKQQERTNQEQTARLIFIPDPGRSQSVIATGQLILNQDSEQDMKQPVGACTRTALELANTALGGSITARLSEKLREEKGWSYGAYSSISDPKGPPAFIAFTSVQKDQTAAALEELLHITGSFIEDQPLEKQEWRTARNALLRKLPGSIESLRSLRALYSNAVGKGRATHRPANWWPQTRMLLIRDLRLSEIRQQTKRITPNQWVIIVVGDPETLPALQQLGYDSVEVIPREDLDRKHSRTPAVGEQAGG